MHRWCCHHRATRLFSCHSKHLPNSKPRTLVTTSTSVSALRELVPTSEDSRPLILESCSTDPYLNLAIEDYLLRKSHPSSRILLFYRNRPCVVIGRNQNPWLECNISLLERGLRKDELQRSRGDALAVESVDETVPIDLVRRRSGGGTVFHDLGNLNYSVIVPNDREFNRRKHAEMVVRGLQNVSTYEVKVNERHDIVMRTSSEQDWVKMSGSAFKLTRGRALHHGTLLFSSPYLSRISELLKSHGCGHIQAKGVESVRSKVGNLKWTPNIQEWKAIKDDIIRHVVSEFWKLYGKGSAPAGEDLVKISIASEAREELSDIWSGAEELNTNEWRFGQTPRFDFDSGFVNGLQLQFHANRGVIEQLTLRSSQAETVEFSKPIHVQGVSDWSDFLASVHRHATKKKQDGSMLQQLGAVAAGNGSLVRLLGDVFPQYDSRE